MSLLSYINNIDNDASSSTFIEVKRISSISDSVVIPYHLLSENLDALNSSYVIATTWIYNANYNYPDIIKTTYDKEVIVNSATDRYNPFFFGTFTYNNRNHVVTIFIPTTNVGYITIKINDIINKFEVIPGSKVYSPVKICGFYPGNGSRTLFNYYKTLTDLDKIPNNLKNIFTTSGSYIMYYGDLLIFTNTNNLFFTSSYSVSVNANASPLLTITSDTYFAKSKINPLLVKLNGNTIYTYDGVYSFKTSYIDFISTRPDILTLVKTSFNTGAKESKYLSYLSDEVYNIEPLRLYPLTSYTYNIYAITVTGNQDISVSYFAIFLGTYKIVLTYNNKTFIMSKNYTFTDNGDETYSVDSEDNYDKIGVFWLNDEFIKPISITMSEIVFPTLTKKIEHRNNIITYCKNNGLFNPYTGNTSIVSTTPYYIGEISTFPSPSVTDLPAKLSLLDNY